MNSHEHAYNAVIPAVILIAGPYLSGTDGDPDRVAQNLARLEEAAWQVYRRGHVPLVGEWVALPLIRCAGGTGSPDDPVFQAYQYPVAERLLERCDAVLRIAGPSRGADLDVARARARGLTVFTDVESIPPHAAAAR